MGKQTKMSGSHFGGEWTKQKLHIVEEYLKDYAMVLKKQKVKKIYVDGFAGSGKTELKKKDISESGLLEGFPIPDEGENIINGSALLSLRYDFDEYYFLELDEDRLAELKTNIQKEFPQKYNKIHFIEGDCNEELKNVIAHIDRYSRCLMFLDPYAMELEWTTLEAISKCGVVDLWYLFPISALNRVLSKSGKMYEGSKATVTKILGTSEWETVLYKQSQQMSLFEEDHRDRVNFDALQEFVKQRFSSIFAYVSPDSKLLRNEAKNSPMFLLCFMMTNDSPKATALAGKLVKGIMKSTEKLQ